MPNIITKLLPISLRRSGLPIGPIKFIVCHDTGNTGSTAEGNIDYYIKTAQEMQASAHYFVDDKEIICCIPETEKAWHVRYISPIDNQMYMADANDDSLGIELCYGGGIDNLKAYQNYCALLASLCQKYSLDPMKQLVAHETLDPSRRTDPINAFNHTGKTWDQFLVDVSAIISSQKNTMDITKDTPQVLKIKKVTITYDQSVNGDIVNTDHPVDVTVSPELIAAVKPLLVEEGWNVTLE